MVRQGRSPFKATYAGLFIGLFLWAGCTNKPTQEVSEKAFPSVDVSCIPNDTIQETNPALTLENGMYYVYNRPFAGFVRSQYGTGQVKSIGSYLAGKQHGTTRTFYADGQLRDERHYRDNFSYGRQVGFWQNGHQKFDFVYYDDKREGLQKQWYETGEPYAFLTYANDQESGMQKAWRQNGKLYINYEVKDGIRYGLQKSALCYTLRDEKFK